MWATGAERRWDFKWSSWGNFLGENYIVSWLWWWLFNLYICQNLACYYTTTLATTGNLYNNFENTFKNNFRTTPFSIFKARTYYVVQISLELRATLLPLLSEFRHYRCMLPGPAVFQVHLSYRIHFYRFVGAYNILRSFSSLSTPVFPSSLFLSAFWLSNGSPLHVSLPSTYERRHLIFIFLKSKYPPHGWWNIYH